MRIHSLSAIALAAAVMLTGQEPIHSHRDGPRGPSPAPDTIFYNGVIYTGEGFAEDHPHTVQAMALADGKVVAIGNDREILSMAGLSTAKINLDTEHTSTYIFPGFNDAHTHLASAGQTRLHLDLTDVGSLEEMLSKTGAYAAGLSSGRWILGGNWDHTLWAQPVLPLRQDLDRITGDHPAFLVRIDGHIAIANSAALKAAGVTGKTLPPQGGAIDLDASGEPTGILRESAQSLVKKVIPPPTEEERRKADLLAIHDALAHGVTSVQDFSRWADFLIFEQLEEAGQLHLRISEWLPFNAPLADLIKMRAHHDANDPMLHTGMLKGFMDGSLGSRTAALKAPYADDPKNSGLPQYNQAELNTMTIERAKAGFQIGFHAIGDRATAMALEAFSQPGVSRTARNRVEHAQVVDPADIPRFRRLGVIASMQPNHLLTDMTWAEARLGPQRAAYSYAWRAFLKAGVPLAFGTDYPVEPITPFRGLYAAVTRMNGEGSKTYFRANAISRGQALAAYTQGAAYAEFAEQSKGLLVPGYDADFVLVDRNLFRVSPAALLTTQVIETWVAGKPAYTGQKLN
jgi:predicted amidohydrolase YtcJ